MRLEFLKAGPEPGWYSEYLPVLILFMAVFAACLLGIWTRPVGFLANIWPANAIMLGLLLRVPGASRWSGWLAGAAGFMAADLLTGSSLLKAAMLNGANLASIAVAYQVLSRLSTELIRLRQPLAMFYIVLAATLGGMASGLFGGLIDRMLFDGSLLTGFSFWWITEVVNYVAILPIFLSAPSIKEFCQTLEKSNRAAFRKMDVLPALAVVLSCLAALMIGGPGAIAFPVLPLLWCGLVYPVFPTAILTLLCSQFALLFIFSGHYAEYVLGIDRAALFSIRLGASVIAVAPIMLSIITRNRSELLAELRYLTAHDSLTGVGSRAAFRQQAEQLLSEVDQPHAVMMVDLDHFKLVNDTHGHAVGDEVLRETARRISACLRPVDRMGRMGGEEFAVFLKNCPPQAAREIAERILAALAQHPIQVDGRSIPMTASIGLTLVEAQSNKHLDALLAEADAALYLGKGNGRNRVEVATSCEAFQT